IASKPVSVEEAMTRSLDRVLKAGYAGGMISVPVDRAGGKLIVGEKACGKRWEEVVKPNTEREVGGKDVLALVLRKDDGWIYVADAQSESASDTRLAAQAGIHSFVVQVLRDDRKEILGVLQIDLGDRRRRGEPTGQERRLLKL